MGLSPVEIKHIRLERALFGYKRTFVDATLEEIAESYEDVWRDRADLGDKVEHLERELVRFRELEALLRTTLVSAERASQELREQARKESELLLTEAHAEARAVTRRAHAEREHLATEARRIRSLLRSALEALAVDDTESTEEREAALRARRPPARRPWSASRRPSGSFPASARVTRLWRWTASARRDGGRLASVERKDG